MSEPDGVAELEIRVARPEEYDTAGKITVAAYRAAQAIADDESYAPVLRAAARRAVEAELLVAVDDTGEVVGTVTLAPAGTEWAEIARDGELEVRMLAVAPAAWGRGIARAIMNRVVDVARERGFAQIVLLVIEDNAAAHRLYETAGFHRVSERDWQPWPELLLMAYELPLTR